MTDPTRYSPPDLPRLLASAGAGDEQAWRELLGLYGRRVYAMARSRCGQEEVAEEITQSVFVTVASKLKNGEYAERGRFESWLFRVTMNRVRDEMRRRRFRPEATDPAQLVAASARPEAAWSDDEEGEMARLRAAVGRLSDADREVVELRHHAGMSFRNIAEMLGEPLGTVLARHHRALKKLKHLLTGDGPEAEEEPGLARSTT